jgi:DHA2 family multidrug resistance protein
MSALPISRTASERAAADPGRASLTTWIAVLAAMIGSFMAILNIQITNASLLNIEGGIGTGVDNGSWISTSYLIGEIIVIPLTDYLSRVFSFRIYMLVSATLFAVFSVACSFTHDLPSMIATRGVQGFAGGVLIPMAFTLVLTKLPKAQQPVGLAIFALSVTFAPAIGPTIGGYLTENYGWRTIFYVNVIPTAVMVSALYLTLERQPVRLDRAGDRAALDPVAAAEAAQLRLRHDRDDAARLRAVRIGLYAAGLSRRGSGIQRRTDRRGDGMDRTAAAHPDSAGAEADAALRYALHRLRRPDDLRL